MNLKDLGARIQKFRKDARLSQDKLAELSGVARNSVNEIEQGRGNPTVETLAALAAPLGVNIAAFFNIEEGGKMPADALSAKGGAPQAVKSARAAREKPLDSRPIFARNIVRLRRAMGFSQTDLANKVGVHTNTIKSIELGHSEGERPTREAIAGALGVSASDLYAPDTTEGLAPKAAPKISSKFLTAVSFGEAIDLLRIWQQAPHHIYRAVALFFLTGNPDYLPPVLSASDRADFRLAREHLASAPMPAGAKKAR